MQTVNTMRVKRWVFIGAMLCTSTVAIGAPGNTTPPKGASDLLGQENLQLLSQQVQVVRSELQKLESLMAERQAVINYQQKEREYRYFTVNPGSFRKQLEAFKIMVGVQKVRWDPGVPASCDWSFDTTFKIDVKDKKNALKEFFSGLPLNPIFLNRDNSIMVYPLSYMEQCTP